MPEKETDDILVIFFELNDNPYPQRKQKISGKISGFLRKATSRKVPLNHHSELNDISFLYRTLPFCSGRHEYSKLAAFPIQEKLLLKIQRGRRPFPDPRPLPLKSVFSISFFSWELFLCPGNQSSTRHPNGTRFRPADISVRAAQLRRMPPGCQSKSNLSNRSYIAL